MGTSPERERTGKPARGTKEKAGDEDGREGGESMGSWDHTICPINQKPGYNADYNYVCSHPLRNRTEGQSFQSNKAFMQRTCT